MKPTIDMIGILTSNFEEMKNFYTQVLGFKIKLQMEHFVEFEHEGVRFAISTNEVMAQATNNESFKEKKAGHSFELAFRVETPEAVDASYKELITKGAKEIKSPETMPWGQRTAFFSDPDGNIHEVFADLQSKQ